MPCFHSVYGLRLRSNVLIPGLLTLPDTSGVDVRIELQSLPSFLRNDGLEREIWYTSPDQDDRGTPNLRAWKLAGGAYFKLHYSDDTEFIVDRMGTQVWSRWPDTSTLEDTVVYLLGPVVAFVLRLRGTTALHASAIAVGDRAVVLMGPAGAGKSTTAAALARLGYPVLADDVVALSDQDSTFWVQPGYPHLRLWPSSVKILYGAPDILPKLVAHNSSWDKRYLSLMENDYKFHEQRLPLAAIYLLDDRSAEATTLSVGALRARAGMMALIANTSANYLLDKALRAQEFDSLSRLVANVAIRRVTPHADPAHLSRLCQVIVDDFHFLSDVGLTTTPTSAVLAG